MKYCEIPLARVVSGLRELVDLYDVNESDLLTCLADRYEKGYRSSSSAIWVSSIKGF